ncbi:MAG: hypothetical protein ROZ37_01505 [Aromatoleum sp.]|jgi:hypothetical protein|nr:hypothetical protein [Aromatoleum sp.]MDT3668990.1 hypothetical protein [Aromatoleum sp.]
MNNVGAFLIALALVAGLFDIASAIRHANVSVNFTVPMRITTEADDGAR